MNQAIEFPILMLASASPRRRELLSDAGVLLEVVPADIDETAGDDESPQALVERLSREKADVVASKNPKRYVIAADTVVVLPDNGRILGKPRSKVDAIDMLSSLSDRTHHVYSGFTVCCVDKGFSVTKSVRTEVTFAEISKQEIENYVDSGEPLDKAGSYAIQGIGGAFIREIHGSYSNVVGLPLCEVREVLRECNQWVGF